MLLAPWRVMGLAKAELLTQGTESVLLRWQTRGPRVRMMDSAIVLPAGSRRQEVLASSLQQRL